MTRRRMIHDNFFQSEGVADWSIRQRLLAIGLIALADDQGRLKGNPFWVKANVFPYDDIPTSDIDVDLAEIESRNDTIIRYEVDGRDYIQLTHWWEYQNLQWAKPSSCPAPDGWIDRVRQMVYKPKRWVMTENWPETDDILTINEVKRQGVESPNLLGNRLPSEPDAPSGITNTNTNTNTNILKQVPIHLATPEFLSEWGEWQQYHIDRGNPLTRGVIKLQMAEFNKWGAEKAVRVMEYSRTMNYTGLVEPRSGSGVIQGGVEKKIMDHIQRWGKRKTPKFDEETDQLMRRAGGYARLCEMQQSEAIQALRGAGKGVAA